MLEQAILKLEPYIAPKKCNKSYIKTYKCNDVKAEKDDEVKCNKELTEIKFYNPYNVTFTTSGASNNLICTTNGSNTYCSPLTTSTAYTISELPASTGNTYANMWYNGCVYTMTYTVS